jgi:hypothetical protein
LNPGSQLVTDRDEYLSLLDIAKQNARSKWNAFT